MKLHLLFVACMTLFIISCGENESGKKKDQAKVGTLRVSNGQCQMGLADINYNGVVYQLDQNNYQLMNEVYMVAQQAYYGGSQQTSGYNGYNGGYPTQQRQYQQIGSDNCTTHYRIEFEGAASNVNGGYGGYYGGGQNLQTLNITSYTIR